jgi:hypothetical protein
MTLGDAGTLGTRTFLAGVTRALSRVISLDDTQPHQNVTLQTENHATTDKRPQKPFVCRGIILKKCLNRITTESRNGKHDVRLRGIYT